jgi:hypothetical protein
VNIKSASFLQLSPAVAHFDKQTSFFFDPAPTSSYTLFSNPNSRISYKILEFTTINMHSLLSAFIALGAFQALAVTAQDPACLANCAAQVRADFTKFSCANADDAACLCGNADFKNGVRDCATPCGSADGGVDTFLNDGFCLAQAPPAEASTSAPAAEPEATQPPAAESTAAPETTAAPESTTAAEPEEQPQPTPVPESTEELAQDTSTEPVQPETTAAPETTSAVAETESSTTFSTKTTAASNAGETAGANDDEDKEDKNDDENEGGLSQTAIIGIGVGAGAAALAGIGLLVWLCLRKRNKQDSRPFIEISKPMPAHGAGDYTGRRDPFAEKRGDVIEMQTNRYEDMLPRQEPRTVV